MAKHMIVSAPAGAARDTISLKFGEFFNVRRLNYQEAKQAAEEIIFHMDEFCFIVENVPTVKECLRLIDFVENGFGDVRLILITDELKFPQPTTKGKDVELVTLVF